MGNDILAVSLCGRGEIFMWILTVQCILCWARELFEAYNLVLAQGRKRERRKRERRRTFVQIARYISLIKMKIRKGLDEVPYMIKGHWPSEPCFTVFNWWPVCICTFKIIKPVHDKGLVSSCCSDFYRILRRLHPRATCRADVIHSP